MPRHLQKHKRHSTCLRWPQGVDSLLQSLWKEGAGETDGEAKHFGASMGSKPSTSIPAARMASHLRLDEQIKQKTSSGE